MRQIIIYTTLEDTNSQLAYIVNQVRKGEEITILHDSIPVAKVTPMPMQEPKKHRPSLVAH